MQNPSLTQESVFLPKKGLVHPLLDFLNMLFHISAPCDVTRLPHNPSQVSALPSVAPSISPSPDSSLEGMVSISRKLKSQYFDREL